MLTKEEKTKCVDRMLSYAATMNEEDIDGIIVIILRPDKYLDASVVGEASMVLSAMDTVAKETYKAAVGAKGLTTGDSLD